VTAELCQKRAEKEMETMEAVEQNETEWLEQRDIAKKLKISPSQVSRYMSQTPPAWTYYQVSTFKKLTKPADLAAWLEKVKIPAVEPEIAQ
jgi:predicted transcriptional regulator